MKLQQLLGSINAAVLFQTPPSRASISTPTPYSHEPPHAKPSLPQAGPGDSTALLCSQVAIQMCNRRGQGCLLHKQQPIGLLWQQLLPVQSLPPVGSSLVHSVVAHCSLTSAQLSHSQGCRLDPQEGACRLHSQGCRLPTLTWPSQLEASKPPVNAQSEMLPAPIKHTPVRRSTIMTGTCQRHSQGCRLHSSSNMLTTELPPEAFMPPASCTTRAAALTQNVPVDCPIKAHMKS